MYLFFIFLTLLISSSAYSKDLRLVFFSSDPPSAVPYRAFDPDSYGIIHSIFDKLVVLDFDGNIIPWLAESWRRLDELTIEFRLRKGVRFHNGDPLTAHDVKFTIELHLDPNVRSPTRGILSSIREVQVIDEHTFRIKTHFPDGMLIYRLLSFSDVLPSKYIRSVGLDAFAENPVGTGPFKFSSWERGKRIVLVRNEKYWLKGFPKYDRLIFVMIPERLWAESLKRGDVDVVINLLGKDVLDLKRDPNVKIMQRLVHVAYQVVMRNEGALADVDVRRALNYAVDKNAILRAGDAGFGEIIPSMGKIGEVGSAAGELKPYEFDPKKARQILESKGITKEKPLVLRALVSDVAVPVARIIKRNLAEVGVRLELSEVGRSEWAKLIPIAKMTKGKPEWTGEMAISMVDNPIKNAGFHYFIFLHSQGPFSLMSDREYDEKLQWAISAVDEKEHERRLKEVDRMIHEKAYIIGTYQRMLSVGMRKNVHLQGIFINGHLYYTPLHITID